MASLCEGAAIIVNRQFRSLSPASQPIRRYITSLAGTVRDILLARIPNVLRSDIYATAAPAGAAVLIAARKLKVPNTWAAVLGGTFCFALRLVSVWRHWNLPKVMNS